MLACGTKCGELEPEAFDRLMRRLRDSSAARAARTDDVAYLLHISKAGGSSLCAAAIKDARLRTIHPLAWRHHVQGTCTRQVVSLIVHVEGVKVPCAAA